MNAMHVAQRMTADEYLAVPYDGIRWELVDGEVIVHQPLNLHQFVLTEVFVALSDWARGVPGRGRVSPPLNVKLDERNVFGPDLLGYAEGRFPERRAPRPYPLPDLAVEVRTPSTWRYDVGAKKAAYERGGLPELWLVDTTSERVLVCRRSEPRAGTFDVALELGAGGELTSPLLPGFALAVSSLFAG